ncbi:MAG: heavy-metal-associated domain-containing protein, partial [Acidimicrobiaceae bacterium]|nr:heavy-metal-associated domain-containing protein [Acidimicrobiaceae bacterium]
MNAPTRLAAYGAGLVGLVAGAYVFGDQVNHGDVANPSAGHSTHATTSTSKEGDGMNMTADSTADEAGAAPGSLPPGLAVSESGYSLAIPETGYSAGRNTVSFQIIGPDGKPVTSYETTHEKDLHLIAVRRDFADFQHVHPVLNKATATWSVDLGLRPGAWRVFTDFVPGAGPAAGTDLVLGSDLIVPGNPGTLKLPAPQRTAQVDGYTVTVTGTLVAGQHSMLDFHVTKDGKPVTDLQPYLGAYGHLVALREGDLAYLHVHPGGEPGDGVTKPGPDVDFGAEVPSAARYHLF